MKQLQAIESHKLKREEGENSKPAIQPASTAVFTQLGETAPKQSRPWAPAAAGREKGRHCKPRYLVNWRLAGGMWAPAAPPAGGRSQRPRPHHCVLVHRQAWNPASLDAPVAGEGVSSPRGPAPKAGQEGTPPDSLLGSLPAQRIAKGRFSRELRGGQTESGRGRGPERPGKVTTEDSQTSLQRRGEHPCTRPGQAPACPSPFHIPSLVNSSVPTGPRGGLALSALVHTPGHTLPFCPRNVGLRAHSRGGEAQSCRVGL